MYTIESFSIRRPQLTLVGAGPGDPDLITLKGVKALQSAQVILYDALVHPSLLEFAPKSCIRRFVGKRAGLHACTQEEINEMIVRYALSYGHVVRLKGGDPFVFGRGYEEIAYAESFQIDTEVIPGVSSATSLPGLAGIPLTTRGVSESFWVLTATNTHKKLNGDLYRAAKTDATVVVLMGLKKIQDIVRIYREAGKSSLPVAVIISGSLPEERILLGQVDNIAALVEQEELSGPALIVLGEAVSLRFNRSESTTSAAARKEPVPASATAESVLSSATSA